MKSREGGTSTEQNHLPSTVISHETQDETTENQSDQKDHVRDLQQCLIAQSIELSDRERERVSESEREETYVRQDTSSVFEVDIDCSREILSTGLISNAVDVSRRKY